MEKDLFKKLQPAIERIIKRRKNPYSGTLSPSQASEGIRAALTTSKALLNDAFFLFEHKRYPRAAALAILAIEEHGKIDIIRRILITDDGQVKKVWQEYQQHHSKNVMWLMPYLKDKDMSLMDQLSIVHQEGFQHSRIPDDIKQAGFYSDISPEGYWFTPEEMITENTAKFFLSVAQNIIPKEAVLTSPEALELMIKHVKPVSSTLDDSLRQHAWIKFYQEAEAMSYIEKGSTERMEEIFKNRGKDASNEK